MAIETASYVIVVLNFSQMITLLWFIDKPTFNFLAIAHHYGY